jgi:hypothetical protein
MQKHSNEYNYHDRVEEEPVALVSHTLDKLAFTWSVGIGIGYAFLVFFICWIVYRCFLIYNAYRGGDYLFIVNEIKTDLLISAGYFGIAIILRTKDYI